MDKQDRDCQTCINHTEKGCRKWNCEYEREYFGDLEIDMSAADDETKEKLKDFFDFDKDVQKKVCEIYRYMCEKTIRHLSIEFSNKMKINIELDASEYRGEVGKSE